MESYWIILVYIYTYIYIHIYIYGGFHEWGYPKMEGFQPGKILLSTNGWWFLLGTPHDETETIQYQKEDSVWWFHRLQMTPDDSRWPGWLHSEIFKCIPWRIRMYVSYIYIYTYMVCHLPSTKKKNVLLAYIPYDWILWVWAFLLVH